VTETFNVITVPDTDTLDPAPFSVHWLFDCEPLPGTIELAGAVPASVINAKVFCAQLYVTAHAPAALALVLNRMPMVATSVAPHESLA
jgi:hypothetical protein